MMKKFTGPYHGGLLFIGLLIYFHIGTVLTAETFIATECFGSVLSLSCKRGHRIKVLDDFFGLNAEREGVDGCQYVPGDCTVTNNRYTSVIHRYCEGKQTCTSFQVDRSTCGTNQTNYEQVEYECVPDDDVLDICTPASFTTSNGYIATPNFPNEYPPNLHCGCSMESLTKDSEIQLDFTHFIVKYDYPCKDWVELELAGQKRRLCGAYRSTLLTKDFNLTFHSDEKQGHQGLWLHFSAFPKDSKGQIKVECGPKPWLSTTEAPTTTTPTPVETTTSELIILFEEPAVSPSTTPGSPTSPQENLPGVPLTTASPAPTSTSTSPPSSTATEPAAPSSTTTPGEEEEEEETGKLGGEGSGAAREENEVWSASTVPATVTRSKEQIIPEVRNRLIPWFPAKPSKPITYIRTTKPLINTTPRKLTTTEEPATTRKPTTTTPATTTEYVFLAMEEEEERVNGYTTEDMLHANNITEPAINYTDYLTMNQTNGTFDGGLDYGNQGFDDIERPTPYTDTEDTDTDPRLLEELRRRNNRTTGIIIISICVGGIVLLVLILGILLCVNKRRKPTPVTQEKNKRDKIQQRLNSLSFYDSIPMFDSVGRKVGMGVASATVEQNQEGATADPTTATTTNGVLSKKLDNTEENASPESEADTDNANTWKVDNGPYWTGPPGSGDGDSDHDSAVYAELDKHSKEGQNDANSTQDEIEPPPTYAVQLKPTDKNEDVYTHV